MSLNRNLNTISIILVMSNLQLANATTCDKLPQPQDYLVCSGSDITYRGSDFQGPTCAVGNVNVAQFALDSQYSKNCQSWTVGGNYQQATGSADGNITAGGEIILGAVRVAGEVQHGSKVYASGANVVGGLKPISPAVAKDAASTAWKFFEDQSKKMAEKKATAKPMAKSSVMTLSAQGKNQVFEIKSQDLQSTSVIKLDGTCAGPFIVNITGENVIISEKDIQVSDRLKSCLGNIFFNFPQAKSLVLKKSGTGKIGVPGTILAPQANLDFSDDLVTGGVFAKSISGSGQVNFSQPAWPVDSSNQNPNASLVSGFEK